MAKPLSILIAGVPSVYEAGLRLLVGQEPGCTVVGTPDHGVDLLKTVKQVRPDVLLFAPLPGQPHYAYLVLAQVRDLSPTTKPLLLLDDALYQDEGLLVGFLQAGAKGYLSLASPPALLLKAIRTLAAGEAWTERRLNIRLLEALTGAPRAGASRDGARTLSQRELQVMALLLQGLQDKEIAARLSIGASTVKAHLKQVYRKLRVKSRHQLTVRFVRPLLARQG